MMWLERVVALPWRQIVPVLAGCLVPVSFGLMLGWPSIAFPLLLQPGKGPMLITLSQSSMISGFLMEGQILGALLSTTNFVGTKLAVTICLILQLGGWLALSIAEDIAGLALARGLVGFGNGFGYNQLKMYISETCDGNVATFFKRYLPLSVNVGVVILFCIGACVDFQTLPLICAWVPVIGTVTFGLIPKHLGPEARKRQKLEKWMRIYKKLHKPTNISQEKLSQVLTSSRTQQKGLISAVRRKDVRNPLLLLWFLIFTQQYTGGAANLVYSQIIHGVAGNRNPKVCCVAYGCVFLASTVVALRWTPKLPRKTVMIASSLACFCLLTLTACYFYYKHDILSVSQHFAWTPLAILCIYNMFHSFGINVMPLLIVDERFPAEYGDLMSKFNTIYFSISAVISTKVFQVFFASYGMHAGFAFLATNALCAVVVLSMFMKESKIVAQKQSEIDTGASTAAKLVSIIYR